MNDNSLYFGFLNGVHPTLQDRAKRYLSGTSIEKIASHTIASDVVEEIVRRDGTFYTADEARAVAPFEIMYDDIFCASFRYIDGDSKPPNPAYSERNWCCLTVYQYSYGVYLTRLIAESKLTMDELKEVLKQY